MGSLSGAQPKRRTLLDRLDEKSPFQFVALLYLVRFAVLLPMLAISNLILGEAATGTDFRTQGWSNNRPAWAFLFMIVWFPVLETIVECLLPYLLLYRRAVSRPHRPWGFVLISAALMAALHADLASILPSLVTGAFLAYCFAHFANNGLGKAVIATAGFHAAINLIGWVVLVS
jgi:hypothetical protein